MTQHTIHPIRLAALIFFAARLISAGITLHAQVPAYVSPDQLVGWYPLTGNANDESFQAHHGTAIGAAFDQDRFGNEGRALYLSGQNAFVRVGHQDAFNALPLTLSCWIKPSSGASLEAGGGPLISKGIGNGANTWHISTMRGGDNDDAVVPAYTVATADVSDNGCACGCTGVLEGQGDCGNAINYDGDVFDDAWHMITFSVDHSVGKLYVDGVLINEQAWAGSALEIFNTADVMIGAQQQALGPWSFYRGLIDDIGIWNRVLSDNEVMALYTGDALEVPCPGIEGASVTDLVGHWSFCGNADDSGPLQAHGTVQGATLVADGQGYTQSAYQFENNSISLPVPQELLSQDYTIHLEVSVSSYDGNPQTLFTCGGLHLYYDETIEGGTLNVLITGENGSIAHTIGQVNPAAWHTITLAQTQGYLMLYINGQFHNEGFYESDAPVSQGNALLLGQGVAGLNNLGGVVANVAVWQRFLDFDEVLALNDATGLIVYGCTDPSACNYDYQANVEDWSCIYPGSFCDDGNSNTISDMVDEWCNCQGIAGDWEVGCIDPSACNFDWMAVVDDGSCIYPGSACDDGDPSTEASYINWWCGCEAAVECDDPNAINYFPGATSNVECLYFYYIHTFYDINVNGVWESDEPALTDFPVSFSNVDTTLYSNSWGEVYFELPLQSDSLVGDPSVYEHWTPTTPLAVILDWGLNSGLWGFTPVINGANAWVSSIWNPIIHCDFGYDGGADVHNIGIEPLIVTAEFTFDSILSPTLPDPSIATVDSIGAGYFSFISDTLYSLEHFPAIVHIPSPGLEYLDMLFPITVTITAYDTSGQVVTTSTYNYEPWVACAYDPNDLTAYSGGHYDQNFVLADERILFRVRFQNTGNLPAEDVLIKDVLNPEVWDLDSFEPVSVHISNIEAEYFDTDIDLETGEVNFYLHDIYLPDSSVSQEASQGYVLFYVNTRADLSHGTVLHNTAEIYFDLNPPIITNTTLHTIYDCSTIQGPVGEMVLCSGSSLALSASQPYIDSYTWSINGSELSVDDQLTSWLTDGNHILVLQLTNALCNVNFEAEVVVHPATELEVISEDGLLIAGAGIQWQWYFEGEAIDATGIQLNPQEFGEYTVVATDANGCMASGTYLYEALGKDELQLAGVLIYPNPAETSATLVVPEGEWEATVTDCSGRLVARFASLNRMTQLDTAAWAPGVYTIRIGNTDSQQTSRLIIR